MGIIQDNVLSCMIFPQKGTFIELDLAMNLLVNTSDLDGVVPQPDIMKPQILWNGKKTFSLQIYKWRRR